MKKINLVLLVLSFFFASQLANATNPISVEAYEELVLESEQDAGFFKKATKWVKGAISEKGIRNMAIISLVLGIASLVGLFAVLVTGSSGVNLLPIALAALAADILAIIALVKSNKNRKANRSSRTIAILGLVTGLLTGLLPLALLLIIWIAIQ